MLHGRATECALIDDLVAGVRGGVPGALVLRGDAGAGRTTLLELAAGAGAGMVVLRAAGLADDVPEAFGGLRCLLGPVADRLAEVDGPGPEALAGALGLADGPVPGRFLVVDGVVRLLAHVAVRTPVLCLVDDVQWIDGDSRAVLAIAAGRIAGGGASPMKAGLLLTVEGDDDEVPGPVEVRLGPLDPSDGAALLRDLAGDELDEVATQRLVLAAEGNPLALVELARSYLRRSREQPAEPTGRSGPTTGGIGLPTTGGLGLPTTGGLTLGEDCAEEVTALDEELGAAPAAAAPLLRRAVQRRVAALPVPTQHLLLVAALDTTGEPSVVADAAGALGLDPGASVGAAEDAELLGLSAGRLVFGHPVLRSAAGRIGTAEDRRRCHQALADVHARRGEADRAAWHRAAAVTSPDDEAASELHRSAARARAAGAHDTAGRLLAAAAELSGEPDQGARLLLAAAEESLRAQSPVRAAHLARRVATGTGEALLRARAQRVLGRVQLRRGETLAGYASLVDGATVVEDSRPSIAAALLVEAAEAAWAGGDVPRCTDAARRARTTASASGRVGADDPAGIGPVEDLRHRVGFELVQGVAALLGGDLEAAERLREAARPTASRPAGDGATDPVASVRAARAAELLGDGPLTAELSGRAVAAARLAGDWDALAEAVDLAAGAALPVDPVAAGRLALEGLRVAEEGGSVPAQADHLARLALLAAWRGDLEVVVDRVARIAALGGRRDVGAAVLRGEIAFAAWELGTGQDAEALVRLEAALADPGRWPAVLDAVPELVEAAVRAGRPEAATAAFATFSAWARATGSARLSALAARCRAVLSAGDTAAVRYTDALALHGDCAFDAARTRLLYGEFLRRERHRVDARTHLLAAAAAFERLGARPWADRARHELRAAGGMLAGDQTEAGALEPSTAPPTRAVPATAVNRASDSSSATAVTE